MTKKKIENVTKKTRRGPLSKDDMGIIEKHKGSQSPEQIAARLNRPLSIINAYLEKNPSKSEEGQGGASSQPKYQAKLMHDLVNRPEWEQFKARYTDEELEHVKYKYVQLMGQFKDDILPTEEMQIFQVIGLEIMIHRAMKDQKAIMLEKEAIERLLESEYDMREHGQGDAAKVVVLESKLVDLRNALKTSTTNHESYLTRQSVMLRELKGTRDQRIKILENSKQSFLGFLRLLTEEDQREKLGREMELFRIATDEEAKRLSQLHTYGDGTQDQPYLTPENVIENE